MATDLFAKVEHDETRGLRSKLAALNLLPYFRVMQSHPHAVVIMDDEPRVNLGSSNYLGLSGDPRVIAAAQAAIGRFGTSLNGSRFMNGTTPQHLRLEDEVAYWLGEEAAIVFPSGYATNLGVISALVGQNDVAVCDANSHASILDGAGLSRGQLLPFRHNRLDRLEKLLTRAGRASGGVLVMMDSVFSMQGDTTEIVGITSMCRRHQVRLLVDEAHAVGVLGPAGQGVAALAGLADAVDLRMGTFSKALAGSGGFVAGPADIIEFLRIYARAYMFTAATPPAGIGAAMCALHIARSAEGDERRDRLAANTRWLRTALREIGFDVAAAPRLADGTEVQTPILRIPADDDLTAIQLWNVLYRNGVYTNMAVYPAVPRGQAQLRVSVMATHTDYDLERAAEAFSAARQQRNGSRPRTGTGDRQQPVVGVGHGDGDAHPLVTERVHQKAIPLARGGEPAARRA
jgi:8-amino-7-oxononanoate synthase